MILDGALSSNAGWLREGNNWGSDSNDDPNESARMLWEKTRAFYDLSDQDLQFLALMGAGEPALRRLREQGGSPARRIVMGPLTEARAGQEGRKENLADLSTPSKPSSHEVLIDRRAADDMVVLLDDRLDDRGEEKPKNLINVIQNLGLTLCWYNGIFLWLCALPNKRWKVQPEPETSSSTYLDVDVNDNGRLVNFAMKVVKELTYAIAQDSFGDEWKCRFLEKRQYYAGLKVAVKCVRIEIEDDQLNDIISKWLNVDGRLPQVETNVP
ncbi:hypothetical protein BDR06DRAFT_1021619 [Suillus hirtellus]|nr:hypothetical protein BDR06DRAFT_1021619 [Suillus hirtellus]